MKNRCTELDVMNVNVSEAINSIINTKQIPDQKPKEADSLPLAIQDVESDNETENSDEEVCEVCPICQIKAYGKVVQCGTCWEWYHFDCLKINDGAIETLGEDDFICRLCTEDLLYSVNNKDPNKDIVEQGSSCNDSIDTGTLESGGGAAPGQISSPNTNPNLLELLNKNSNSDVTSVSDNSSGNTNNENKSKSRPVKRSTKPPKLKKEEVIDKTYVLELESQINQLQSTLELYKKVTEQRESAREGADTYGQISNEINKNQPCSHKCCTDLTENLQENRIRLLETHIICISIMRCTFRLFLK